MKEKRIKLNDGTRVYLPKGIQTRKVRQALMFAVVWKEGDKQKTKVFSLTQEGLNQAIKQKEGVKKDIENYGVEFGSISKEEKQALDMYRAYVEKCKEEKSSYKSIVEVMSEALQVFIPQSITPFLSEVINQFLLEKERGSLNKLWVYTLTKRISKIEAHFSGKRIGNITQADILNFIDNITYVHKEGLVSNATRNHFLTTLRDLFNFAIKRDIIEKNPCNRIDKRKTTGKEVEILTVEQAKTILEYIESNPKEHKHIPVLVLGLFCGVRVSERTRVKLTDFHIGEHNLVELRKEDTKTGHSRNVSLRPVALAWLEFAKLKGVDFTKEEYVLTGETEDDRRIQFNLLLARIERACKFKMPHNAFRHSAASYIGAAEENIELISMELGHSREMHLKHYRKPIPKRQGKLYLNLYPVSYERGKKRKCLSPDDIAKIDIESIKKDFLEKREKAEAEAQSEIARQRAESPVRRGIR